MISSIRSPARYATRVSWARRWGRKLEPDDETASEIAAYYQAIPTAMRSSSPGAPRACLTRNPAYGPSTEDYLLRTTTLGPAAVRALARPIPGSAAGAAGSRRRLQHPRHDAGYRVLRCPIRVPRVRRRNIEILIGTLLRPCIRKTRLAAFDCACQCGAAQRSSSAARARRAREALKLPNKKYPRPS